MKPVPMLATLSLGIYFWSRVDPEREIFAARPEPVFITPKVAADAHSA